MKISLITLAAFAAAGSLFAYTERELLAATLSLEAANQGRVGREAVANVVINRAKARGQSVEQILLARAQFSSLKAGPSASIAKAREHRNFKTVWSCSYDIAGKAIAGQLRDRTNGAQYFENIGAYGRPKHYRAGGVTIKNQYFWR